MNTNHQTNKPAFSFRTWCIAICIGVIAIAGCGAVELSSHWTAAPIDITSMNSDLQNALAPIEGKPAMIGILNDSNYIYLSLVISDRSMERQMTMRGFTIWFDPSGGDTKRFGIKFPLGIQPGDFQKMREEFNKDRDNENNSGENVRPALPPVDTIEAEILGPKEGSHERVKVVSLKQIGIKLFISEGRLQYNLKVPLTDNGADPYAIGTTPGSIIGVGLETAAFERRAPQQGGGDEEGGGGMGGGMGGGRRGGRGGGGRFGRGGEGGGGGGQQQTEPLNLWSKVQLATGK